MVALGNFGGDLANIGTTLLKRWAPIWFLMNPNIPQI